MVHKIFKNSLFEVGTTIAGLRRYTVFHFSREIELLEQVPTYPKQQLTAHKAAHKMFVDKVTSFEQGFQGENMAAVCELVTGSMLTFLVDWLGSHIQNTDMKLEEYFNYSNVQAEKTRAKMASHNVDMGRLSGALLAFFKSSSPRTSSKFEEMDRPAFRALLKTACPEYEGQSDVIFEAIDTDNSGDIDFAKMFTALVSGPLLDGKFSHVKWTAAKYGCQNPTIDEDHQELFDLINLIVDAVKACDTDKVRLSICFESF